MCWNKRTLRLLQQMLIQGFESRLICPSLPFFPEEYPWESYKRSGNDKKVGTHTRSGTKRASNLGPKESKGV